MVLLALRATRPQAGHRGTKPRPVCQTLLGGWGDDPPPTRLPLSPSSPILLPPEQQ